MRLRQLLNEKYVFFDKNRDKVQVGNTILFSKNGLGGTDGWTKGIIANIDGGVIKINSLEAKDGQPNEVTVTSWKMIDKI